MRNSEGLSRTMGEAAGLSFPKILVRERTGSESADGEDQC